jgi:hypothetical protein
VLLIAQTVADQPRRSVRSLCRPPATDRAYGRRPSGSTRSLCSCVASSIGRPRQEPANVWRSGVGVTVARPLARGGDEQLGLE